MDLNMFARVLVNSLWQRTGDDLSTRKAIYRFKVGEHQHINYAVNLDRDTVASSAYPHDLPDFRPEILNCQQAWRRWFLPWICEPNVLALIDMLYTREIEAMCNVNQRRISWQAYIGDYSVSIELQVDENGRAVEASLESYYYLSVPDEFYNPIRKVETLPLVLEECRSWMEAIDRTEIVYS